MSRSRRRTTSGKAARWSRRRASTSAIVQVGTQNRSGRYTAEAIEYIRSGKLGRFTYARDQHEESRADRAQGGLAVPAGVDYDMWLGPAPKRPFNPNRFHYNWHWFWDYAGGDIGNDGIHQLDIARWVIGKDYPNGRARPAASYICDDDQETPDTQVVTWDFDGVTMGCQDGPVYALHEEDAVRDAGEVDLLSELAVRRHADRGVRRQGVDAF